MHQAVEQLQAHLYVVWKRRWLALVIAFVSCLGGWVGVYTMPDKYVSMARVFLDTQSMLTPVLEGLAAVDDELRVTVAETTRRTLLSRPNIEKVIRQTDMDLEVKNPEEHEKLVKRLGQEIQIKGDTRSSIYVISYKHQDPVMAKKVVESLLSIFMEDTLGTTRVDTSRTKRFLNEQILEHEKKLLAAEERLKEFKRENVGMMPGESGGYFQRMQNALESFEVSKLELGQAEKSRDELSRQLNALVERLKKEPIVTSEQSMLDERIHQLERGLDEMLIRYTEEHPDVQELVKQIDGLKEKRKEITGEPDEVMQEAMISANPIYQELKVELSKTEAQISLLTVRRDEFSAKVDMFQKLINTVPEVEAQLARLNRDYNIHKKNYEELVARRESTNISSDAARSANDIQFRLIDPPVTPLVPVSPNRPVFLTVALLFGLAFGAGVAWLVGQIRPTFSSINELSRGTDFPVYGAVSLVVSKKQRRRERISMVFFVLVTMALLAVYAFVLLSHGLGLI